ncbi:MAG: hypothetical protein HZA23_05145 [Nitrospirae bacterium]|nr:hypothetical protein [Nitrospirota bacterium]
MILFSVDPEMIRACVAGGIDAVIVDLERVDKRARQAGFDTEVNNLTLDDVRRVRTLHRGRLICRINPCGPGTRSEVEDAIAAGTDELLLPMVRTVEEAEGVLGMARGRCGVGILVETVAAVERVEQLARLPITRAYVGLNDLAIERKTPNLFTPLVDGMVEKIRRPWSVPFGLAGLTLPDRGEPIPCRLLIGEMARLRCWFSFLRRSFHRDIKGRDPVVEIPRIREAIQRAFRRDAEAVERDRRDLENAIHSWSADVGQPEG